jgi:hypothetical protein
MLKNSASLRRQFLQAPKRMASLKSQFYETHPGVTLSKMRVLLAFLMYLRLDTYNFSVCRPISVQFNQD